MIRVMVVDDEHLARRGVVLRLQDRPDFRIIGEYATGASALEAIRCAEPDLIFLDVQMPEMTGLELLRQLAPTCTTSVIFLTAFDAYALDAFEHHAIDYLLKPIDDERFEGALKRVMRLRELQMQEQTCLELRTMLASERSNTALSPVRRFAIKSGHRISFVATSEIDWVEAEGDYAALHVGQKRHLIRESLNELSAKLDRSQFLRVHRSAIVRVDRIKKLDALSNGDGRAVLIDGTVIRVSRTFSKSLRMLLRNHPDTA